MMNEIQVRSAQLPIPGKQKKETIKLPYETAGGRIKSAHELRADPRREGREEGRLWRPSRRRFKPKYCRYSNKFVGNSEC